MMARAEDERMYVENTWYVAACADEVGREPLGRIVLDRPIVLYRKEDGAAVALEDRCCHRRAPLHKGTVVGDALQCGYHGFVFDAAGKVIEIPGQSRIPPDAAVESYPVVERHQWIWVWIGDPARADEALVPDFHSHGGAGWAAAGTRLGIACNYQLIVDNLLDLSHVAFVHTGTIGTDDSEATLSHERGDDFVRLVRKASDIAPPPLWEKQGFVGPMEQIKTMTFAAPAFVWIDIVSAESRAGGANAKSARLNVLNAITPETESTSHYFWANARDFDLDNGDLTKLMFDASENAFQQDKDILEAQQRCIDLDPTAPMIDVGGDVGGLSARRIVERLIADQAASS
jgi:vanillate O-demethylase monooxygenase subunit